MNVCLLTVSDRASQGLYEDLSGPAMRQFMGKKASLGWLALPLPPFFFLPVAAMLNLPCRRVGTQAVIFSALNDGREENWYIINPAIYSP